MKKDYEFNPQHGAIYLHCQTTREVACVNGECSWISYIYVHMQLAAQRIMYISRIQNIIVHRKRHPRTVRRPARARRLICVQSV